MKKAFLAMLLTLLLLPAFSLSVEAAYLNAEALADDATLTGFMAGIGTSNPIFNVSGGLYYDSHEIRLKHKKQVYRDLGYGYGYWDFYDEKEKKDDTLIGSYIKFDWSILPIKRKNFKAGTNFALLIAAAHSDLWDFEIPVSATASLQVRFKNIDVLAGFQYVIYALCSEDYSSGGGNGGFPIAIRYNFNAPQVSAPPSNSRTHIIGGSGLIPSL